MSEHYKGNSERNIEIEKAAVERAAELREQREKANKIEIRGHNQEVNEATQLAEKLALAAEEHRPTTEHEKPAPEPHVGPTTREKSYKQTMRTIQREMSAPERTFSKVIHNKAVEKVSDTIGSTVARPNAILSGAICAFVLVGALYLIARQNGFALQGSETIATFVLGWLLGIAFDFLRLLILGKR